MTIVAKATRVRDLAQRLSRSQRSPALHKARGVIQADRKYELTAGRAALCENLLEIAQRDPHLSRNLVWTEIWIGKAVLNNAANTREQLVGMT